MRSCDSYYIRKRLAVVIGWIVLVLLGSSEAFYRAFSPVLARFKPSHIFLALKICQKICSLCEGLLCTWDFADDDCHWQAEPSPQLEPWVTAI